MKIIIYLMVMIYISLFNQSIFSHEIKENEINQIIKKFIFKNPDLLEKSLVTYKNKKSKFKFLKILDQLKNIPNPKLSNSKSNITIYEFFDYNCGYCKSVMKDLIDIYEEDKQISIVFVELPILSKTSLDAALASLSAHKQKKYIDFHVNLMSHRGKINQKIITEVAEKINLDVNAFKKNILNSDLMNIIDKNREIAQKFKLRGTPAFIIGETVYPGALSKSEFKTAIKLERSKDKK